MSKRNGTIGAAILIVCLALGAYAVTTSTDWVAVGFGSSTPSGMSNGEIRMAGPSEIDSLGSLEITAPGSTTIYNGSGGIWSISDTISENAGDSVGLSSFSLDGTQVLALQSSNSSGAKGAYLESSDGPAVLGASQGVNNIVASFSADPELGTAIIENSSGGFIELNPDGDATMSNNNSGSSVTCFHNGQAIVSGSGGGEMVADETGVAMIVGSGGGVVVSDDQGAAGIQANDGSASVDDSTHVAVYPDGKAEIKSNSGSSVTCTGGNVIVRLGS